MKMHKSPLEAIIDGAIAGAVGSYAIRQFYAMTSELAPEDDGRFIPPELEQKHEQPTETVARRVVEGLAHKGRISPEHKRLGGQLVQYGYGATFGALYGATAESIPMLRSAVGAALFGTKVGLLSAVFVLPKFGLAAAPSRYGAAYHAYHWAAHVAYGAAVVGTYRALSTPLRPLLLASLAIGLLVKKRENRVLEEDVIVEDPIEPFYTEPEAQPGL